MRYETCGYAPRAEIVGILESGLASGHLSARRQRQARAAIAQLEAGLTQVRFGPVLYVVDHCA